VPEELDPDVAEDLVDIALGSLPLTRGNQVLCTKRQLRECMLRLAQEAYATGFLSGEKQQFDSLDLHGAPPSAPGRPQIADRCWIPLPWRPALGSRPQAQKPLLCRQNHDTRDQKDHPAVSNQLG
jgi:hypothetical protein